MNPKIPAILSIVFAVLAVVFKIFNFGWFAVFFVVLSPLVIAYDVFYILLNFLWVRKKTKMPPLMAVSSLLVGVGMTLSALFLPDFGDTEEIHWLFMFWTDKHESLINIGYTIAFLAGMISVAAFVMFVICYFMYSPKDKNSKVASNKS